MFKELAISAGIVSLGWVVYALYYFLDQKLKMRKFNGPFALPAIGNAYDPQAIYFLKYLSVLRNKYGKLYTLFSFFSGFLVVCDPVVVRRILSDSKVFYKGKDYADRFSYVFGEGLVTSNGEKHRRDRSTFGRFFIRSSISAFAAKMNKISRLALHEFIDTKFEDPNFSEYRVNIEHFFAIVSLRNFMNYALSQDFSNDREMEEYTCELVSRCSNIMGSIIVFGLPMWSFLPYMKYLDKMGVWSNNLMEKMVGERKQRLAQGLDTEIDDCISVMINENMTREEMAEHFVTLVAAGHDTTSFFLSYLTYVLATHQDVQDKLYAHICEKLQNKGPDDPITAEDFGQMRYLHLVMMETLRYYAIIPCVTRVASEDVYIKEANVTLPKGINLLCPMVVLNRDPEIWDKPSEFIPERFAERGNDFTSARDGYFPFGYGSRTCIGNLFAQIEAGIVLTMMMRKYRFDPEPGFRPNIRAGISLTTSNGIHIVLRRR